MTDAAASAGSAGAPRFGRAIERRDGRDFPFYDGQPVEVATWRWVVALASVVVALLVLMFVPVLVPGPLVVGGLISQVLFPAIMLVTFGVLVGRSWTALFRRVGWADVGNMFFFAVLTIVVSIITASLLGAFMELAPNEMGQGLSNATPEQLAFFFAGMLPQLLGEELMTIIPFLAILTWFHRSGMGRTGAVLWAWGLSALWFGLVHLPTYDWNVVQVIVIIAVNRLVLTAAYVRTKNLWVSTGAHVINDGLLFAFLLWAATIVDL